MAKYLLKPALIPTLKAKGFVSNDDVMVLKIPHREANQQEQMFELTFNVYEAVETTNHAAMIAIEQTHSPAIQVGGEWFVSDPSVPWFDKLPDGDLTTSKMPHVDGAEHLTPFERSRVRRWLQATGNPKPASWRKSDASTHLASAMAWIDANRS